MDGTIHEGVKDSYIERLLSTIKYVDFFEAMRQNEYSHLKISSDEYFDVLWELQSRTNIKQDHIEKQLQPLRVEMQILSSLAVITTNDVGVDVSDMLKQRNITSKDNLEILDALNKLMHKTKVRYDLIDGRRPKFPKAQTITGFDVLSNLSASLEYRIPTDICIAEYIGHHNTSAMKNKK